MMKERATFALPRDSRLLSPSSYIHTCSTHLLCIVDTMQSGLRTVPWALPLPLSLRVTGRMTTSNIRAPPNLHFQNPRAIQRVEVSGAPDSSPQINLQNTPVSADLSRPELPHTATLSPETMISGPYLLLVLCTLHIYTVLTVTTAAMSADLSGLLKVVGHPAISTFLEA